MKTTTKILSILAVSTITVTSIFAATSVTTDVNNIRAAWSDVWSFWKIISDIFNPVWKITWDYLDLDISIDATDTDNDVPSSKAVKDLFDLWQSQIWNTNGPNKIYYNSWSVWIGTTNPQSLLHLASSSPYIRLEDTDDTNGSQGTITSFQDGAMYYDANRNNSSTHWAHYFRADGATKVLLSLLNNGSVWIGTTSPSAKLHVKNSTADDILLGINIVKNVNTTWGWARELQFHSNSNKRAVLWAYGLNNTLNYLYLDARGTAASYASAQFVLKNNGNVWIGTTNPSAKLEVNWNGMYVTTPNQSPWQLRLRNLTSPTRGLEIYQGDTGDTYMRNNNISTLTMDTSGNVWIGTTSPSAKLEVSWNIIASWSILRTAHNNGALVWSYDNVWGNSLKTNPIYSIGSNYLPWDSTLWNHYWVGYTSSSASFISNSWGTGWWMYVSSDWDARHFLNAWNWTYWNNGWMVVDNSRVISTDAWLEWDRIRQNSVDSSEIENNTIASVDILDNTLTAVDLAANSVGNSELVNTENYTMNNLTLNGSKVLINSSLPSAITDNNQLTTKAYVDATVVAAGWSGQDFWNQEGTYYSVWGDNYFCKKKIINSIGRVYSYNINEGETSNVWKICKLWVEYNKTDYLKIDAENYTWINSIAIFGGPYYSTSTASADKLCEEAWAGTAFVYRVQPAFGTINGCSIVYWNTSLGSWIRYHSGSICASYSIETMTQVYCNPLNIGETTYSNPTVLQWWVQKPLSTYLYQVTLQAIADKYCHDKWKSIMTSYVESVTNANGLAYMIKNGGYYATDNKKYFTSITCHN